MIKWMLLIIAVLLIAGCAPQSELIVQRYTGTQGLVVSFIPDMPPDDEVYEDSSFKTGLELYNTGANDAQGYLSVGYESTLMNLRGIDTTDLDTGQTTTSGDVVEFNLAGKGSKGEGYQGQRMRSVIDLYAQKIALSEKQDTQLNFNICYNTKTSFKEQVCIDPDIYNEVPREKACTIQDISTSRGQGAPISITKVETRIIPEGDQIKPRFKIFIKNNQGGLIVDESKIREACIGGEIGRDQYSIIGITPTLDGQALKCTRVNQEGKFDLSKTFNGAIECETAQLYNKGIGAHLETIEIDLNYGYVQTGTKTITVYKKQEIA